MLDKCNINLIPIAIIFFWITILCNTWDNFCFNIVMTLCNVMYFIYILTLSLILVLRIYMYVHQKSDIKSKMF